jgi:hypothetical protein
VRDGIGGADGAKLIDEFKTGDPAEVALISFAFWAGHRTACVTNKDSPAREVCGRADGDGLAVASRLNSAGAGFANVG